MTPEQTASRVRAAVDSLGGAFLTDPRTLRHARELGLSGWAAYVGGRGGALGDVAPDTVAAAFGLIAPGALRTGWLAAAEKMRPASLARVMLAEGHRWGTEYLDDLPGAPRLAVLAEISAQAADGSAMPLFAAWRALAYPGRAGSEMAEQGQREQQKRARGSGDDEEIDASSRRSSADEETPPSESSGELGPGARAAVALHLLQEHRAGVLLVAVRASGLSPVEALISGPDGQAAAVAFGWEPPYPRREPLLRRRAWADQLADRLAGQAFVALSPADRTELVSLVEAAQHKVRA